MRGVLPTICVMVAVAATVLAGCRQETAQQAETGQHAAAVPVATNRPDMLRSGEALFKQYCSSCHPNGGNVSDPRRPLYGSALKRNHLTRPEDIVRIMRNPVSRMIRFDVTTLSDKDALAIAEYILVAFK